MSRQWAERQRRTNCLCRLTARHVLGGRRVTARQLYGLCQLTWITKSYKGKHAGYITRTKIPGLGAIFSRSYSTFALEEVAEDLAAIVDDPEVASLIKCHTGFTNFYNPYRPNVEPWIKA